ncbi:MAG TPA: EamA family transporter [Anaerovoracaceae bacterium]|nr:EamA family transporter [Anaerovoracaceae bacterium]
MTRRDYILAIALVTLWGANFTVIKFGLTGMPPLLLAALRYILTVLPAIFFIRPPAVGAKYVIAYGMTVGVGQFSCLFYAMHLGMPAGISSVVLQSQVFFTLFFAAVFLKESLTGSQILGVLTAGAGLCLIGGNVGAGELSSIPTGAFFLTVLAAAFWGISNIIARYASRKAELQGKTLNMLSMVVWSSLVSVGPFLAGSLLLDGPETIWNTLSGVKFLTVFSVLYLAYAATLFGYGNWNRLLAKYPAGKVAPLSLLVPVTGLITSQIVLREHLSFMQWAGGAIIVIGLMAANFGIGSVFKFLKTVTMNRKV